MRFPESGPCSIWFVRLLTPGSRRAGTLGALFLAGAVGTAGAQAAAPRLGSIRGLVFDSLVTGQALAEAEIEVFELGRRTRADSRGMFRLDSVAAGRYSLSFTHPTLAAFGFVAPERIVDVGAGIDVSVVLATPSAASVFRRLCRGAADPKTGVLVGRLSDAATEAPIPAAEIRGEWVEATFERAAGLVRRGRSVRAATDSAGRFQLCGVPTDVAVVLTALTLTDQGPPLELELHGRLVATRNLSLARGAGSATARVAGTVRGEDQRPIEGALVTVLGRPHATRTDSAGRYALTALPAGSHTLEARAIGYGRRRAGVELRGEREASASLTLPRLAVPLPDVNVVAAAAERDRTGFEGRRATADGHFIGREDIRRRGTVRIEDLFKTVPGLKVEPLGATEYQILSTRGGTGFATLCVPTVFVDGIRIPQDTDFGSNLPVVPEEIHGIEVYRSPAAAPPRYQTAGANCGVILIWSRRGGRS